MGVPSGLVAATVSGTGPGDGRRGSRPSGAAVVDRSCAHAALPGADLGRRRGRGARVGEGAGPTRVFGASAAGGGGGWEPPPPAPPRRGGPRWGTRVSPPWTTRSRTSLNRAAPGAPPVDPRRLMPATVPI